METSSRVNLKEGLCGNILALPMQIIRPYLIRPHSFCDQDSLRFFLIKSGETVGKKYT